MHKLSPPTPTPLKFRDPLCHIIIFQLYSCELVVFYVDRKLTCTKLSPSRDHTIQGTSDLFYTPATPHQTNLSEEPSGLKQRTFQRGMEKIILVLSLVYFCKMHFHKY